MSLLVVLHRVLLLKPYRNRREWCQGTFRDWLLQRREYGIRALHANRRRSHGRKFEESGQETARQDSLGHGLGQWYRSGRCHVICTRRRKRTHPLLRDRQQLLHQWRADAQQHRWRLSRHGSSGTSPASSVPLGWVRRWSRQGITAISAFRSEPVPSPGGGAAWAGSSRPAP